MKKMSCLIPLCLLLSLSLCGVAAAESPPAEPVALVYWLQGEATLTEPSGERRPLRLFDRLPKDAVVEAAPGSRLALAFANGRRYELAGSSRVTLGRADLAGRSGPVLTLRPVPPLPRLLPVAAEERPGLRAGAVRIRAERIEGLQPDLGMTTLAGETVLRFLPVEGGRTYRIEIRDREGNLACFAMTKQ